MKEKIRRGKKSVLLKCHHKISLLLPSLERAIRDLIFRQRWHYFRPRSVDFLSLRNLSARNERPSYLIFFSFLFHHNVYFSGFDIAKKTKYQITIILRRNHRFGDFLGRGGRGCLFDDL